MSNRRQYMADYHARNKDAINKRRRERYKHDTAYRAKVAEQRRRYARKAAHLDFDGEIESISRQIGQKMRLMVGDQGHVTEMFKISQLCTRVGVTRSRFAQWYEDGWFPRPCYKNKIGHYLYTEHEFYGLSRIIMRHRRSQAQKGYQFRATDSFKANVAKFYKTLHMGLPREFFEDNEDE